MVPILDVKALRYVKQECLSRFPMVEQHRILTLLVYYELFGCLPQPCRGLYFTIVRIYNLGKVITRF